MTTPKILIIDKHGPDFNLISKALQPFGYGLAWTERLDDACLLIEEEKPALVIVDDRVDGLSDPASLLDAIQSAGACAQLVVKTAEPDFEKAMEWVTDGVFAAVKSPVDIGRLREIASRALDGHALFEKVAEAAQIGRQGEDVYKRLAGHLETSALLQSLADTARKTTGATYAEASADIELDHQLMASSGPMSGKADLSLSLALSWLGRNIGRLRLCFDSAFEAQSVDKELITELVQAGSMFLSQTLRYEEAVRMASRDPLTGLCNKRVFLETLEREYKQAKRHNSPLSLLTLDLDHFKLVNDTYGHQVGDELLKWLSGAISRLVRSGDLPSRIGGEEFAVILPRTTIEQAQILSQRLKESLVEAPLPVSLPHLVRPTVSQGLASLEHFLVNSTQDLIYWSDQAMYLAKREGRNAIRVVSDLPGKTNFQDVQHVFQ
jgi:diguanylate cyclase (GGDEF)-like protein